MTLRVAQRLGLIECFPALRIGQVRVGTLEQQSIHDHRMAVVGRIHQSSEAALPLSDPHVVDLRAVPQQRVDYGHVSAAGGEHEWGISYPVSGVDPRTMPQQQFDHR